MSRVKMTPGSCTSRLWHLTLLLVVFPSTNSPFPNGLHLDLCCGILTARVTRFVTICNLNSGCRFTTTFSTKAPGGLGLTNTMGRC
ncbi:uncharacterized protein BDR25DRAFT_43424 [Lindgomyces ingoldianus]|uniref:Uncharacterized protein n=1 Tax=Lindgomyces ingoldianus TaxID=673940 RepID=A0ACB6RD72_9PLEO|nr:uncharacterized protein BDR25DRAFT_43424 [Lindgomyces ingoldianus]KAF2477047.1 hypothetical protein BDR25DRAFT_43424 [Lindgomyces ingoldianus]